MRKYTPLILISAAMMLMASCGRNGNGSGDEGPVIPEGWRFVKSLDFRGHGGVYSLIFSYDRQNRVTRIVRSEIAGSTATTISYSDGGMSWRATENGVPVNNEATLNTDGFITRVVSTASGSTTTTRITYNDKKVVSSKKEVVGTGAVSIDYTYLWDANGNLVELNSIYHDRTERAQAAYDTGVRTGPRCNMDLSRLVFQDSYYSTIPYSSLFCAFGLFGQRSTNPPISSRALYSENTPEQDRTYTYQFTVDEGGFITSMTSDDAEIIVNYIK